MGRVCLEARDSDERGIGRSVRANDYFGGFIMGDPLIVGEVPH